jgi:small subunit ribosomal protein S12
MAAFSKTAILAKIHKIKKSKTPKLQKNPQKKAICSRLLTIAPTKPNSANRRIAKTIITKSKARLTAKITGESHNLQQHSIVLIQGARIRDLIGVNYSIIRGKYDLAGVNNRKKSKSLFGVKKY